MNQFFASLKETGIQQLGMSITFENEMVSVSILPNSKENKLKSMKPLVLSASIEEMDEKFFETIQKPLEKTRKAFDNVESYQASLKAKASVVKTESAKKPKDSISKKYTELQTFIKGKNFNALKDHEKTTQMAKGILALNPEHKEAQKIVEQMAQYKSQNLFQDASN